MGKVITDGHNDGGLDAQALSTMLTACSAEPTSQANIAVVSLASVVVGPGDFTIANGDVSGRKVTTGAKTGVSITASGDATHIVVDDGTDYTVTTCATTSLTSGGTVDFNAWDREILDPTP